MFGITEDAVSQFPSMGHDKAFPVNVENILQPDFAADEFHAYSNEQEFSRGKEKVAALAA